MWAIRKLSSSWMRLCVRNLINPTTCNFHFLLRDTLRLYKLVYRSRLTICSHCTPEDKLHFPGRSRNSRIKACHGKRPAMAASIGSWISCSRNGTEETAVARSLEYKTCQCRYSKIVLKADRAINKHRINQLCCV